MVKSEAKEKAISKLMLKEDITRSDNEKIIKYVINNDIDFTFMYRRINDNKIVFFSNCSEDFKNEVKEILLGKLQKENTELKEKIMKVLEAIDETQRIDALFELKEYMLKGKR